MRCEEFHELLDGEGAAATPEAAAHAESCPSCGRALERWTVALRELRALTEEPEPPFLSARVMAAVRAEGAERVRPAAPWWRARLAPALAVLVMASLGGWALWQALRGVATPVQEARLATTVAEKGKRDAAPPALGGKGALPPAAAPQVAPLAPASPAATAPARRAAAKGERGERRVEPAATTLAFAPEPASAPAEDREAELEQPRAVGGVVGGVLAAAPANARGAEPAAERPLEKGRAASIDEIKARPGGAVIVRLAAADGAEVFVGPVEAALAPPPGAWWRVQVADDGTVALADGDGRDIGAEHPDTLALVRSRRLAPGVYRLSR